MIAGCNVVARRALRNSVIAAGVAAALALSGQSSAQTMTVEQLMRQLEGKPITTDPTAALKGRAFRSRSFTAKEPDPVPEPAAAAPTPSSAAVAAPPAVQHPEVDLEIYFTPASAKITKQAEPDLNVIGKALSHEKFSGARFRIAGHTDGIGGAAYNLALSKRRAEAVRAFLISRYKITPARIEAVGFGKDQLKVPDDVSSPRNRRVQIVNLSAAK